MCKSNLAAAIIEVDIQQKTIKNNLIFRLFIFNIKQGEKRIDSELIRHHTSMENQDLPKMNEKVKLMIVEE